MGGFGNAEAFQADVVFRTNVSQFEGDQAQIRALAERTYGSISRGSLDALLANEKYERSLARSKGSAFAVAKATQVYEKELDRIAAAENRAAAASGHHSGALKAEEQSLAGVLRGGIAGSGVLNRFGRAAIFASSSVLGGYGLVYALRSTIGAAREQEVALGHLQVSLKNSGLGWAANKKQIDETLGSLVKTTGFTDNDLTESIAATVRRFGDLDQGLNATAIATDVARAKNISLAEATNLVIRASFGQSRAAKSLGVDVSASTAHVDALRATTKNATAEQLRAAKAADQQATQLSFLDQIQQRYHGNAERFARDNPQAVFNAELERTKEIVGGALLPDLDRYLIKGSDWLEQMNESGKLQKDVNKILHDTETVVHDVTGAIKTVDHVTGGFKNTLELMLALKVGSVIGGWAVGVGRFAGALRKVAGAEKAVAGANVAAEISGIGGAATVAEGEVAALKGSLLGLPTFIPIAIAVGVTYESFAHKGQIEGAINKGLGALGLPGIGGANRKSSDAADRAQSLKMINAAIRASDPNDQANLDALYKLRKQLTGQGAPSATTGLGPHHAAAPTPAPTTRTAAPPNPGTGGGNGTGGGLPYSLQNALLEAQGTPGTADDMKVLNDQLGYLNRALAQKGLSPADRNQLLSERNDVLSQRDQIMQAATQAQKQAAAAAARKQKQRFSALAHVPAVLVKRFADAEAAHKPSDVLEAIRRQEIAALRRQEKTLKSDHAPESYIATIAKEIDAIQGKIDAAIRKARKARIEKLDAIPVNLRIAEANAIANNASAERLAAIYQKERAALDKQLAQLKKIHATKQDILKNRQAAAAVEKKLTAIEKQQKADTGALARELQDAVAGLAQYAPNVTAALASIQGGPTVHVTNQFPGPPSTDFRHESLWMKNSLEAAFDG